MMLPSSSSIGGTKPSVVADAVLKSLVAASLFTTLVAGIGVLLERDAILPSGSIAVLDCEILAAEDRAVVVQRYIAPIAGRMENRVVMQDLNGAAATASSRWSELRPRCVARLRTDGRFFIGTRGGTIYSASGVDEAPSYVGRAEIRSIIEMDCTADGSYLLVLGDTSLSAWDLRSQSLAWRREPFSGICLATHPRAASVVCGLCDGQVVELALATGETRRLLAADCGPVLDISIIPDGSRLVYRDGYNRTVLLDWWSGRLIWQNTLKPGAAAFSALAFSPCSRFFVTTAENNGRALAIWNVNSGQQVGILVHERPIRMAKFAADGRLVAWDEEGSIRTWRLPIPPRLRSIPTAHEPPSRVERADHV